MRPTFPPSKLSPILQVPFVTTTSNPKEMEVIYQETSQYLKSTTDPNMSTMEQKKYDPLITIISVAVTALICTICFLLLFIVYRIRQKKIKIADSNVNNMKKNFED